MHRPQPTRADRTRWAQEPVTELRRHPAFIHTLMRPGVSRYTSDYDVAVDVIAAHIACASENQFALYLGQPLPGLFQNARFVEALCAFLEKPNRCARIIYVRSYCELLPGDEVLDLSHPRRYPWRPFTGEVRDMRRNERFLVTDTDAWWFNDFGPDQTDVTSSYGIQSRTMGNELWGRFDAFKAFPAFNPFM